MKVAGYYLLTGAALLLPSAVQSQDANSAVANTPYASIVARNMFGLLPIPQHDPKDDQPPADPPPKITPNGIMTIFGKDQALFKVANKPKSGQPAKEDSYVLAEGEMQDDIEVVKINHQDEIITFNNHGVVQELPLVVAKETGGPAPGSGGGPGGGPRYPGMTQPGMIPPPVRQGVGAFPGRVPVSNAFGNNSGNPSTAGGLSFSGATGNQGNQVKSDQSQFTPEQQVMLIEAQRMKWLQEGNPAHNPTILPPTPLTDQVIRENGGGGPPAP